MPRRRGCWGCTTSARSARSGRVPPRCARCSTTRGARAPDGTLEATVVADAFCHSMVRSLVGRGRAGRRGAASGRLAGRGAARCGPRHRRRPSCRRTGCRSRRSATPTTPAWPPAPPKPAPCAPWARPSLPGVRVWRADGAGWESGGRRGPSRGPRAGRAPRSRQTQPAPAADPSVPVHPAAEPPARPPRPRTHPSPSDPAAAAPRLPSAAVSGWRRSPWRRGWPDRRRRVRSRRRLAPARAGCPSAPASGRGRSA